MSVRRDGVQCRQLGQPGRDEDDGDDDGQDGWLQLQAQRHLVVP